MFLIFKRASSFRECAKFRGSWAIVGLVGLVLSCHCALVGISLVENIFLWVFRVPDIFWRGSQTFSRRYFVGPIFFLSVFRGSQFFSWVFRGSQIFSRGYFVGSKFFSWEFRGRNYFSWIQNFLL